MAEGRKPEPDELETPAHLGRPFPRAYSTRRTSRSAGYTFLVAALLGLFGTALWGSGSRVAAIVVFVIAIAAVVGTVVIIRREARPIVSDPLHRR